MKIRLLFLIFLLTSLRGFSQSCSLSVSITSSEPGICAGNTIGLTATPSGGTGSYDYAWSTGETVNPIHVNKAGNYTVTVTDKTSGCTASKTITVSITPTPAAPVVTGGGTLCKGTIAHLQITSAGDSFQWYTQASGGSPFHTGISYDTPPVNAYAAYYVETTTAGCTSARVAVYVNVLGQPTAHNVKACAGSPVTLSVSDGDNYSWYTSNTSTNVVNSGPTLTIASLNNSVTYYVSSTVNGCTSQRTAVSATVTSAPQSPTVTNNNPVCSGSVITLHADAPSGVVDWFDTPSGGTPLISSPDYTTPVLTANTTYYVQNTLNDCQSSRVPVTVTVTPIPAAPPQQTVNSCYNSSAHLTAGTTGTYQWYADADGKHFLKQGLTYDTPPLTHDITYYLMAVNSGCNSTLSPVNVVVAPLVPAPSVLNPPLTCYGSTAELTATAPGGTYQWFATATDNNALPVTQNGKFTTPALTTTTTYYVQTVVGQCTSARTAVKVPVLGQVSQPVIRDTSTCSGNPVTLTASGPAGNYAWYDSSNTLIQLGQTFTTPALTSTTTYTVQLTVNGCASAPAPVKVTVTPLPQSPVAGPSPTICPGTTANLTASVPAGESIDWYAVPSGGVSLHTGNSYTTPPLSANTTYYLQSTSGACTSARTPITVNVDNSGTTFAYPSSTFATTGANPTPTIINPSGSGTFSAPSGIVFISTTTGQINVGASSPGSYIIVYTSSGTCSGTYSVPVTITDKPNTAFTYNTPICKTGANPKPQFAAGASAGVFTASPAGLTFVDSFTGEIDLKNTTKGTYTIQNTIPPSGGFAGDSSTFKITIDDAVVISAGGNQSVPLNTPVTLNGSITGASGGTWSGGAGKFSNVNDLHAVYTPAVDESKAVLTLVSNKPAGACNAASATVTILFNTPPPAPTAKDVQICTGSSATLTATAPGGNYDWFNVANGGSSIKQGATYTTPVLTATTTYYVQTTVNGLKSPRTAVTVTIYDVPPTPATSADTVVICAGGTAKFVASGSVGNYQWFNESGQTVATGATFTTSPLNTSTFYNVQSVIGQCVSAMKKVVVIVNSIPYITSTSSGFICSGNPLNYTITANLPNATFNWRRAAVAGISNPAVSNQTNALISETLINTTANPINVTYAITPIGGTCSGTPINYVVTVYPTPLITSRAKDTICNGTSANYTIKFNTANTSFSWGRAAVPGITNNAVSGQASNVIREVLYNTNTTPVDVVYTINYKTNDCDGAPFSWVVTVNPALNITSDTTSLACNQTPQNYTITSNVPTATFTWSRAAVPGISNAAATGNSALIDETLINTTISAVTVNYILTPIAYGCTGLPFTHPVKVNPKPGVPPANSNSPVCLGNTINLRTPSLAGATYMWTGPNGYSSTSQNPDVPATIASAGTYNLFVTVGGCTSDAGVTTVQVNQPPLAKATGPLLVCVNATSIPLKGSVTGGTTTGIWSSSNPKGKFLPSSTTIDNVQYIPSAEEKAVGNVTITLSSTSKDDCTISTSTLNIVYGQEPGADAGKDQNVCSQDQLVQLAGKILVPGATGFWSTAKGDGQFHSGNQVNASYSPGPNDIKNGSVMLTFNVDNSGQCYTPSDSVKITFFGPAALTTEKTRYVLKDKTITLHPSVNDNTVAYLWAPNYNISDIHIKEPVITGSVDTTYTLTITDSLGCVTTGKTHIVVSPTLSVSNAFSPNGDGTNDTWEITGLVAYENSTVDVFNRYGTLIFHSKGYGVPWDGKSNGQPVPVGVYYFIVDTKVNGQRFTGYVTVLR
ncbi:Ig-like domain-containing protein [Mucilaginibacter ginsenosidivorax]|uniref:T9SS type B sorting domain-containing protein n=1 Tax=Mucilaginibacter ginsenosidivorax TaxID=862126 RepID=A0A5B8W7M7_9SPHI|nr:PKD-like domain-containing protein [Mucilaginibacter ginsenosidivorax]QEC80000.1 T9SS type B sorting domain-containing protein [Mucilaginibacter ginsenosidivorax]